MTKKFRNIHELLGCLIYIEALSRKISSSWLCGVSLYICFWKRSSDTRLWLKFVTSVRPAAGTARKQSFNLELPGSLRILLSLLGAHCRVSSTTRKPRIHSYTSNGVPFFRETYIGLFGGECRVKRQVLQSFSIRITRECVECTDPLSLSPGMADLVWLLVGPQQFVFLKKASDVGDPGPTYSEMLV